jgi:general secretion pathway protein H
MTNRSAPLRDGFTLLEVLVVIAIIGTVISLAALSFGENRARGLEREAERLQGLLRLAVDEAVIRSVPMGLVVEGDGYHFLQRPRDLGQRGWVPMADDRTFGEHKLPGFAELEMTQRADALSRPDDDDGARRPDAIINATGALTPFQLTLRAEPRDPEWRIIASRNGEIALERHD